MSSVANVAQSGVQAVTSGSSYEDILKTYLITALEKTGNLVDKSVDMVMEQAPILMQEVLHWYFAYNLILFILGLIVLIAIAVIDYKLIKWEQSDRSDKDGFGYFVSFMFSVITIPLTFLILINLTWLKIYIAPRLWLIEYAASLVK